MNYALIFSSILTLLWLIASTLALIKYINNPKEKLLFSVFYGLISLFALRFTLVNLITLAPILGENFEIFDSFNTLMSLEYFRYVYELIDLFMVILILVFLVNGFLHAHEENMQESNLQNNMLQLKAEFLQEHSNKQGDIIALYEAIGKVKKRISQTIIVEKVYRESLYELTAFNHYHVAFFGFLDSRTHALSVPYHKDVAIMPFISDGVNIEASYYHTRENDPTIEAIDKRATIVISNPLKDVSLQHFHSAIKFSGIKTVISIPMIISSYERPMGALTLFSVKELNENSGEIEMLEDLVQNITARIILLEATAKSEAQAIEIMEKNALLEKIIETVPARIFWKDRDLIYQGCNRFFATDAKSTPEEVIGKSDHQLIWADDASDYSADDNFVIDNDENVVNRVEKQGDKWILTNKAPFKNDNGAIIGVVGVYVDVTLQKKAEDYLRENEKRFRELLELIPNVAINGCNANFEIIYWNKQCENLYGYTKDEVMGKKLDELIYSHEYRSRFIAGVDAWVRRNEAFEGAIEVMKSKVGGRLEVNSSHVLLNRLSSYPEIFNIDIDVTNEKIAERMLIKLANYDALTNLPNRHNLDEYMKKLSKFTKDKIESYALFFIDIDNFKYINDSFGHSIGDLLLVNVADRLKTSVREHDFVARFGGDEFIVVVRYKNKEIVANVAKKIHNALKEVFLIKNREFYITVSIGVSFLESEEANGKTLLAQADSAMYAAKDRGKNSVNFFTQSMSRTVIEHMRVEALLRKAISDENLMLYYQPQVSFKDGTLKSCEALIRWKNEDSFIAPDLFLPIAEQAHLMDEISRFVIKTALATLAIWKNTGLSNVRIDINIPSNQIYDRSMINFILRSLNESKINPKNLGIEITEGKALNLGDERTLENLNALKNSGLNLSIDDFGTGYSSLNYLMSFEIDTIKIDREFIINLDNSHNQTLVKSIIAMTQALGYNVVAEGVETDQQKEFLIENNCDLAQGFGYHKPMSREDVTLLIEDKSHS